MQNRITGRDARPIVTIAQMSELRRLGFDGPVAYMYRWEASREISKLRAERQYEQMAVNRFAVGNGRAQR